MPRNRRWSGARSRAWVENRPVDLRRVLAETAKDDLLDPIIGFEKRSHRLDRDFCRQLGRKAVGAGADRGKGDGADPVLARELEGIAVAAGKQLVLVGLAAVPHRPHRVDDPIGGQPMALGDLRLARGTAAKGAAFVAELESRGVLTLPYSHGQIRAVTHYGIGQCDIERTVDVVRASLAAISATPAAV